MPLRVFPALMLLLLMTSVWAEELQQGLADYITADITLK
jgi:hypothetical protein